MCYLTFRTSVRDHRSLDRKVVETKPCLVRCETKPGAKILKKLYYFGVKLLSHLTKPRAKVLKKPYHSGVKL